MSAPTRTQYETVIGLEVHIELATHTKMFCGCANAFGKEPNTSVCPVCMALPGALPVPNQAAVQLALRFGLAVGGSIRSGKFDRKNYFYPDLPKGYQISQFDLPVVVGGVIRTLRADGTELSVRLTRAHLEEDAGKLAHTPEGVAVDFNRAGVPLLEVVSEPDLRSPEDARLYFEELRLLAFTLGISDAQMQEGSLRADANVSLRPFGQEEYGARVEVKNLNSFRSVERAIVYEVQRQSELLDGRTAIRPQTRGWDDERGITYALRDKEGSDDYRYFPEPDLPPLVIEPDWIEGERGRLPELPADIRDRLREAGVRPEDAQLLARRPRALALLDASVRAGAKAQTAATWLLVDGARLENAEGIGPAKASLTGRSLAQLIDLTERGTVNMAIARTVFERMWRSGGDPEKIVAEEGLAQVSDPSALAQFVEQAIAENAKAAADVTAGKFKALGALIGAVMRKTRGRASAGEVERLLRDALRGPERS